MTAYGAGTYGSGPYGGGPDFHVPRAVIRIDITNAPTNTTRVWTDITPYVRRITLTRDGRSNETERTQPGRIQLLLDNTDGRFDRDNTSGPYYPNLKTTRWLQVQANWLGDLYDRWTGLIDIVSQSWPTFGKDAVAEISGTTALKVLNLTPIDGAGYTAQLSGSRVSTVIASSLLSSGTIDTGAATLPALNPGVGSDSKALNHLQAIEAEEQGIVFTDGSGKVQFHDRHHRWLAGTVATIGDNAGEIPYGEVTVDDDDQFLFTAATRNTSDGSGSGHSADATAGTAHFVRDDTQTMLTTSVNEAQAAAEAFVLRYKEPALRINTVNIRGNADVTKWPAILNARNSDQYQVVRRAAGGTVSHPVFLEQVRETIAPGGIWETQWSLSPAAIDAYVSGRAWRVGNATYGKVGTFAIGW